MSFCEVQFNKIMLVSRYFEPNIHTQSAPGTSSTPFDCIIYTHISPPFDFLIFINHGTMLCAY